ncbi:helix-turn-helix domain-containing protein [Candidatus Parcubacteria bacterium]|nr:helix-turn-helix domain-containing protein [Candidatus Parcubacteria bacterium]
MTPLVKRLTSLGFPEKDAGVYLALLKAGAATVQEIARQTGINRSSVYVVLDRLMRRGFVSIVSNKTVRQYSAAPPERLMLTAKEEVERSTLLLQNLATLSPTLRTAHKSSQFKPKIEVLEGAIGLQKGFENALSSKEKVMRVFSSTGDIFKSLPEYLPIFVQQRLMRGLKMRGIHPDDEASREMIRRLPNTPDEITLIPRNKFRFPSDFGIYDEKVAFMSHRPPFCVMIQSKEIAEVMKVAFDLAQKEAVRYKVNKKL